MKQLARFILLPLLLAGCTKEIILTEEKLPDEIFYPKNSNIPYTGKCIIHYKNTDKIHYTFHFEKGILNGEFRSYFTNGKTEYLGNYCDGELSGDLLRYNEEGEVTLKYHFQE